MKKALNGKVAIVTGATSGIGLASAHALIESGARVVLVARNEAVLNDIVLGLGDAAMPLPLDLTDVQQCASLVPRALALGGQIDILHANAGMYLGGDLVTADTTIMDRLLNLNVNAVMKNVHDVLPHMIERGSGDIIVTSSLAAHFPTPWEPVYASSKWAINCFVQTVRRQVAKQGIRVGAISPGPVVGAMLDAWPEERLREAVAGGAVMSADVVADTIMFMLTRRREVTIRDVVIMPSTFDL